jgi:hypothetical protein
MRMESDHVGRKQVLLVAVDQVGKAATLIGWRSDRVLCISTDMAVARTKVRDGSGIRAGRLKECGQYDGQLVEVRGERNLGNRAR